MAYKDPEKRRAAIREHYHKNKAAYLEKNRKRRIELRKRLRELKESSPCKDCGVQYPSYVMDFDHLEDKEVLISKLVNSNNITALFREIAKCEIVCANCHRIRTYRRIEESKGIISPAMPA